MIATTDIANGEAYYAMWGRFPAWSYYDHPPLVAWITWVVTRVSSSPFALHVGPLVCATVFAMLVYRLAERLFSARAGFFALALVALLPAYFVTAIVINPESPLAPLWMLAVLLLDGMRERDEAWRPLAAGAVMGLAFLAKYTGVLLVPLALVYLAATPSCRRWLRRPSLYAGAAVALAVASPVVVWNLVHHWPSLTLHFVERTAPADAATLVENLLFLVLGQLGEYHPLLFPALMAAMVLSVRRARTDERFRFLAWMSVPVLVFLAVALMRVRDPEPHWTMVGFMPCIVAAAGWLDEAWAKGTAPKWLRPYGLASGALTVVVVTLGYVHTLSPALLHLVPAHLYDPNHDATTELQGWDRVDAALHESAELLGPDAVIASCQYALCAQILRQVDDRPAVYCPSARRTEFDFLGRHTPPARAPVLYVNDDHYPDAPGELLPGRRCDLARDVPVERAGRVVRHYRLYACSPETPEQMPPGSLTLDAR